MTTPERENTEETEAERFDRQQKEVQAAAGQPVDVRGGSTNAQNTPGPETQTNR